MKKIKKLINALKHIVVKPSIINLITNSNYAWGQYLMSKNQEHLPMASLTNFVNPDDINEIKLAFLGGSSLATDYLLLKSVCQKIENCTYFEIGTWRGESVINVAPACKECYTLNLSKEEMLKNGMNAKYADLHSFFSKNTPNIKHLFGNSLDYDFESLDKKFDVIFIDGNHNYQFVVNDTKKVFKYLTHKDSIVIWHDYAYEPELVRSEVLAGITDALPKEMHKNLYHVSNTMCAIYMPIDLEIIKDNIPLKPLFQFDNQIVLKKIDL